MFKELIVDLLLSFVDKKRVELRVFKLVHCVVHCLLSSWPSIKSINIWVELAFQPFASTVFRFLSASLFLFLLLLSWLLILLHVSLRVLLGLTPLSLVGLLLSIWALVQIFSFQRRALIHRHLGYFLAMFWNWKRPTISLLLSCFSHNWLGWWWSFMLGGLLSWLV